MEEEMKNNILLISILLFSLCSYTASQTDGIQFFYDANGPWAAYVLQIAVGGVPGELPNVYCLANNSVYKSTNRGDTWVQLNINFQPTCIMCESSNPDILYIGSANSAGIYKSTDGGSSFNFYNQGLPGYWSISANKKPSIAISPYDNQILYLGMGPSTTYYSLYCSTDGGASWSGIDFDGFPEVNLAADKYAGVELGIEN